jgi:prenylcysteine oxidase/farnesylcysteine lyase
VPVTISLFERDDRIGGRSTTVHAYNDSREPVELGASIFIAANRVLYEAVERYGLELVEPRSVRREPLVAAGLMITGGTGWKTTTDARRGRELAEEADEQGDALGIWNGERIVFSQKDGGPWDMARLVWRYGIVSPWRVRGMVKDVVARFLRLYPAAPEDGAGYFPWVDLTRAAQRVGLANMMGVTGEQMLVEAGVGRRFYWEVVQAA